MNFLVKVFHNLFGIDATPDMIFASFVLVFLGAFIHVLVLLAMRKPLNDRSPIDWSWRFFFKDNAPRLLLTFTGCIIAVIFGPEVIMITGTVVPQSLAKLTPLVLGILSDNIPFWLVKKFSKTDT